MGRIHSSVGGRRAARVLIPAALLALALQAGWPAVHPVSAATPNGTIDGSAPVSWDFAPVGGLSMTTDSYALTVKLPSSNAAFYAPDVRQGSVNAAVLTVTMTWTGSDQTQALGMSVTDPSNNSVGNDTTGAVNDGSDINVFTLQDPLNQTYTITASDFAASTTAIGAHAVATLQLVNLAAQGQPAEPNGALGYDLYHLPLNLMPETTWESAELGGRAFGEPSIGVDPNTDAVLYQAGLYTLKATFDTSTPAVPTWTNVSDSPLESSASLDAILDVDRGTGRMFVSQLTAACSLGAVSDDDGATWTTATKPCETPPAVDHETIGAGPFASPLPSGAVYKDAVYYCSQNVAEAECALSLDGGLNYGAASPMWNLNVCFGLHGHVKVAPDGTVYVPDKACGSPECEIVTSTAGPNCHPGFAVSTNNGLTWTVHTINDMHSRYFGNGDPSIGIGAAGTMYYGFNDRDGHPKVAVCTSQGTVCAASVDVSGPFDIQSVEMPTVVAGDDNRAAFAFLGSSTPGDDQQNAFVGTWHLYIAVTYNGGATWTTTDATPTTPIQRGCIEFAASCPSSRGSDDQRNLLDFNDLTIDKEGRVLAAYTDGCQQTGEVDPAGHGTCLADATRLSGLATEIQGPAVARQNCGLGLYARYDSIMTACSTVASTPEAPSSSALVLGGAAVFALTGIIAWRRRRRRSGEL